MSHVITDKKKTNVEEFLINVFDDEDGDIGLLLWIVLLFKY